MNVLLISPRIAVQKGDFLGSGIPYWPIELAILAGFLTQRGENVRVWDSLGSAPQFLTDMGDHFLQGRNMNDWLKDGGLPTEELAIVYAMSSMSHGDVMGIIQQLRLSGYGRSIAVLENSQAVTAYALPHVRRDLFGAGADLLICGEPYWNWDDICCYLSDRKLPRPGNCLSAWNAEDLNPVKRMIAPKGGSYAVPAWERFCTAGYWAIPYAHGPKQRTFLPILTSRGCPYPCDFCVVPETNGRKWRARSAEEVVAEMLDLQVRMGVSDFHIEDLNPTVNTARWREISSLLINRNADIRYYIVSGTKAETLDLDDVALYAKSGCRYISISPESGSEIVMKAIGKPFDYDHGLKVVELCHRHGIRTQACFVVGHPAEREEDHHLSRRYLRRLLQAGLDEAAFFIVAPLAGSKLQQMGRIEIADTSAMISFSPKGRANWKTLQRRRRDLIVDFALGKLRQGAALWAQIFRSIIGRPETKIENLFRRVIYIYVNSIRART